MKEGARRIIGELRTSSVQLVRVFIEEGAGGPYVVLGVSGLVDGVAMPAESQEVSVGADQLSEFRRLLDRALAAVELGGEAGKG
jgi:hypothetical protein